MSYTCENCGKSINVNTDMVVTIQDENTTRIFCKQCGLAFGHCPMCQHNIACDFFNNPDPMPQFVVVARQMRQGNATFIEQKQIPNAERIKKFCIEGKCPCYNGDEENPLCCRHGGCATCTNYCELEQYKFGQNSSVLEAI